MKIISFNVGTTHLMHFNKRLVSPFGEIAADKRKRVKNLHFEIKSQIKKEKPDFLCIQEGFEELFPANNRFEHLTEISKYEVKHGQIGNFKSSYLATYIDLDKYDIVENGHYNQEYQRINFNQRTGLGYPCRTQIYEVTVKTTRKRFILVNFHGVGDPRTEIRERFLVYLTEYLSSNYSRDDVIIVGDINTNLQKRTGDDGEMEFAEYVREGLFSDFNVFPKNENIKSSYHRFIRNPDNSFTDKPKRDRYDSLDYCLVKKLMGKEVSVKRIPKRFNKMEVPYKLNTTTNILEPNFNDFPSDHTLNIYHFKRKPGFLTPNRIRIPVSGKKNAKSAGEKKTKKKLRPNKSV
tara:strand:+ start:1285 stop:2331 length:1047 start_codon:yes stop_codon:yes gene_type:complete